jgi:hypothetical protein
MRSGALQGTFPKSACFSSGWSTQGGILEGASAHSSSSAVAEWPRMVYHGSWETIVCRMRRVSSAGGSGSCQSNDVLMPPLASATSIIVAERRVSSEAFAVWGCAHVSAVRRTRFGALWRFPPRFADLRKATCISRHAALWRIMASAL